MSWGGRLLSVSALLTDADCRCSELNRLKDAFVLRRTAEVNAKFLPPASTYIVFCRPSTLQACSIPAHLTALHSQARLALSCMKASLPYEERHCIMLVKLCDVCSLKPCKRPWKTIPCHL